MTKAKDVQRRSIKGDFIKYLSTIIEVSVEESHLRFYLMITIGLSWNEAYRIASKTLDLACGMVLVDV